MTGCPGCGAPVDGGQQCPSCGALLEEAGPLELDLDAVARPARAGVERPDEAQIGGSGGAGAIVPAPEKPRAPARPGPPPGRDSRSFAEREHGVRMATWRITRIPVLLILGWFTLSHLAFDAEWVFIDNVNLLLHEAGHVLFSWGGDTITALGGTLGQLMWPAIFAAYFWWKQRQRFAAVACAWWFAENFMTIARYVKDAPREELPLVGGNVHDWAYLFRKWGLLSSADEIAGAIRVVGAVAMIGALALLVWWTLRPSQQELESD